VGAASFKYDNNNLTGEASAENAKVETLREQDLFPRDRIVPLGALAVSSG
jgi:hypothetical protein